MRCGLYCEMLRIRRRVRVALQTAGPWCGLDDHVEMTKYIESYVKSDTLHEKVKVGFLLVEKGTQVVLV